jgi:hypothetical protein
MKRILIFAVFVLACLVARPLQAQSNPFDGTWKLNLEKSAFGSTPAPKSMTRTVTTAGGTTTYKFEGIAADGKTLSYSFSTNYDGKPMPIMGSGMPYGADVISLKHAGPGKSAGTLEKAGKVVATATAVVSKDGKEVTVTTKGAGGSGIIKSVYDKQ